MNQKTVINSNYAIKQTIYQNIHLIDDKNRVVDETSSYSEVVAYFAANKIEKSILYDSDSAFLLTLLGKTINKDAKIYIPNAKP